MYSFRSARPPLRVLFLFQGENSVEVYKGLELPGVPCQVRQLTGQSKNLHFRSKCHLVMRIEFTMTHEGQESIWRADTTIQIGSRVIWVYILAIAFQMGFTHLCEGPCR